MTKITTYVNMIMNFWQVIVKAKENPFRSAMFLIMSVLYNRFYKISSVRWVRCTGHVLPQANHVLRIAETSC